MLANIGMVFAVAVGFYLIWMVARFWLQLRAALIDAAAGSWESTGDNDISSIASMEYVREEIVIRNGHASHVTILDPNHQSLPLSSAPHPVA